MAIEVWDTGRGVPAEAIPRVFEKFFQVQKGDTRLAGGAGLGLYIVRQLVEAQGGTIGVSSSEGAGARFSLRFPVFGASPGVSARSSARFSWRRATSPRHR